MSVWPSFAASQPVLTGREGTLVAVSVPVEPRRLEAILDALACLDFPINPQIYHDAQSIYRYADGSEEIEPVTLVEFPAYENRLPEIRRLLELRGFDPAALHVADMLHEMHRREWVEPAPPAARYQSRILRKYASPPM
ncbi:MAG TPA: hypothetical protein VG672_12660 [Bryobacteraceae bacterium]|nr:hypothetical protein [Bryobacteraceae bacterium]